MSTDKKPVDLSTMSSDELIDHWIVLLAAQAETVKAGTVDYELATLFALLHMARSLDQMEYRVIHLVNAVESLRAGMKQ